MSVGLWLGSEGPTNAELKVKGSPRLRQPVGKVEVINHLGDTTAFKKGFKRTQFLADFKNAENLASKVMLVKIQVSFL